MHAHTVAFMHAHNVAFMHARTVMRRIHVTNVHRYCKYNMFLYLYFSLISHLYVGETKDIVLTLFMTNLSFLYTILLQAAACLFLSWHRCFIWTEVVDPCKIS